VPYALPFASQHNSQGHRYSTDYILPFQPFYYFLDFLDFVFLVFLFDFGFGRPATVAHLTGVALTFLIFREASVTGARYGVIGGRCALAALDAFIAAAAAAA
jgi:hypothetical protein